VNRNTAEQSREQTGRIIVPRSAGTLLPNLENATHSNGHSGPDNTARARHPSVHGRFLNVNGRRFWIKGVTYGTFRPNADGEPFPTRAQVQQDFERMREVGVNSVRLYTPPPDWVADAAHEAGLFLIPDVCWGPRRCDFDDPARLKQLFDWTREHSRRLANHPSILLFSIGN
jgi:O-antigen biosynthesis protein